MWATQNSPQANMRAVASDGRFFTNYNSEAMERDAIQKKNGLTSNEEYRRYLVQNTTQIIQYNYEHMAYDNNTEYSHTQYDYGPPHLYKNIQEDTKPYGYEDTSSKQMYLSREQLDDKKRRLMKDDY